MFRVCGLGVSPPMMENQMETKMEYEMETTIQGLGLIV